MTKYVVISQTLLTVWLNLHPGKKVNSGSPYPLCNSIYFSNDMAVCIVLASLLLTVHQHDSCDRSGSHTSFLLPLK